MLERFVPFKGRMMERGFRQGFALGLGVLILILGGALGFVGAREGAGAAYDTTRPAVSSAPVADLSKAFEAVTRQVEPAVVNISTEQIIHATAAPSPIRSRSFSVTTVLSVPFSIKHPTT
jgi:hypothetical protein